MKINIELDIDENEWEFDRHDIPKKDEWYLSPSRKGLSKAMFDFQDVRYFIFKKKVKMIWVDATLELVQNHYKWGEYIPARFTGRDGYTWTANITGYNYETLQFISDDSDTWMSCQIQIPEVEK